jgi:hypothetical protein
VLRLGFLDGKEGLIFHFKGFWFRFFGRCNDLRAAQGLKDLMVTQVAIQEAFAPVKKIFPKWLSNPIRSTMTAFLAPVMYGYQTGFFLSCFKKAAVSKDGKALPWYTYPSIDFLKYRAYEDKVVLEFGGGQSTLWWAERAKHVVTIEGDPEWYGRIKHTMPDNVDLSCVSMRDRDTNAYEVEEVLASRPFSHYDVVVIDGLYREEMVDIACRLVAADGIIVCDNSEGYEIYDRFKERGLNRLDFYGNAPGVVLPHCTSIYFKRCSFVLDPAIPIHVIAEEW